MKFFVDTASVEEIEKLVPLGIVDGVTTNPSLLAKEGGDPQQISQGHLSAREGASERGGGRDRRRRHDR